MRSQYDSRLAAIRATLRVDERAQGNHGRGYDGLGRVQRLDDRSSRALQLKSA